MSGEHQHDEHENNEHQGVEGNQPEIRAEWFPAAAERLHVSRPIAKSRVDVERSLRVEHEKLVRIAYGVDVIDASQPTTIDLVPIHSQPWLHVPALVEFFTPTDHHGGAIILLSWRATRGSRYFPVLEASLAAQPGSGNCELVLDGTYRPPLGMAGLIFDRYIGRRIATAVAVGFVEALAGAIEKDEL